MYQKILEQAKAFDGPFMERLVFFMTNFSDYIEKSGLKLCQEWVRNTVDPDLIDDEEDKPKVYIDIDAVTGLILDGIERGEVKADAPVAVLLTPWSMSYTPNALLGYVRRCLQPRMANPGVLPYLPAGPDDAVLGVTFVIYTETFSPASKIL